jgi:hypothetical protein|tara:strand:+ start:919 stop:1158 length:240 start_codon:yes stop_codon:yes gene_type:complete
MLKNRELTEYCSENDVVQIVTNHTTGMGRITKMTENALLLTNHNDDKLTEEYGEAVPFPTIFPYEEINLILIIKENTHE